VPSFIDRIENTLTAATATWPRGGRILVTIVVALVLLAIIVAVIRFLTSGLRGR
jgi:hypothetical protein